MHAAARRGGRTATRSLATATFVHIAFSTRPFADIARSPMSDCAFPEARDESSIVDVFAITLAAMDRAAMTLHSPPAVTRAAEGLWRRRFTVADVEAMVAIGTIDASERIELIGGELVPMSPKGRRHERIKVALTRRWCKLAPDDIEVATETTFRLSVDTFLEPDFMLCDRARDFTTVAGGDALLVVEVADSSRRYDTGRKAALYASFGVRELWVIDAVKLKIRVFRDPAPSGFRDAFDVSAKATATPLCAPAEFALRLADLEVK